jgi:hypothetical protein
MRRLGRLRRGGARRLRRVGARRLRRVGPTQCSRLVQAAFGGWSNVVFPVGPSRLRWSVQRSVPGWSKRLRRVGSTQCSRSVRRRYAGWCEGCELTGAGGSNESNGSNESHGANDSNGSRLLRVRNVRRQTNASVATRHAGLCPRLRSRGSTTLSLPGWGFPNREL